MNKFNTLIVLTQSYPYDKALEKTFLEDEILLLNNYFSKTFIIPKETKYQKYGNVGSAKCVTDFNDFLYKKKFIYNLNFYTYLIKIIFDEIRFGSKFFNLKTCLILIKSAFLAASFLTWFNKFYFKYKLKDEKVLVYSFWFDSIVSSLSWFNKNNSNIFIVTRCHSIDLYEDRRDSSYIPFRNIAINNLNLILPDSARGSKYLKSRYPNLSYKIQTLFQGINESGFTITNSTDNKLRFISCSYVSKRKRVDQIFNILNSYSLLFPQNPIEWYHIGSGPDFELLSKLIQTKTDKFQVYLLGNLNYCEMLDFYKYNKLDVFLNFSDNEGTPVSLMEAASCGFPFIVTDVGGNSDVVTSRNGFTIDPLIRKEEIFKIINQIFENKQMLKDFSVESNLIWKTKFNLTDNIINFINTVNLS